jgi:hypothetical protein
MTTPLALPFDAPLEISRPRKAGHVRETSVLATQALSAHLEGRAAETLQELKSWQLIEGDAPTSGELAMRFHRIRRTLAGVCHTDRPEWMADLLFIRRGLSDAQTRGVVEAVRGGKRKCRVTGRICTTWRLRQR